MWFRCKRSGWRKCVVFVGLRAVARQRAARAADRDGATEREICDAAIRRLALSPIPIFYAHLAVSIIDGICACGKSNVAVELRACQTIRPCTYPVIAIFLLFLSISISIRHIWLLFDSARALVNSLSAAISFRSPFYLRVRINWLI